MAPSGLQYFPVAWPFLVLLVVLLGVAAGIVAVSTLRYASAAMGIGPGSMLLLLVLALAGSYVNIPIAYLPAREITHAAVVSFFGIRYVIPVVREAPATVIAINVGGALIPGILSVYLILKNRLLFLSIIGVAVVAAVCHRIARPVPGLGIAEPVFIPPAVTAVVAVVLSRRYAAPLAYISGSLGTLIGADLLNLGKVQGLGAPIASIGGAGTFDGIFVTGLLALLYASLGVHLGAGNGAPPRRARR